MPEQCLQGRGCKARGTMHAPCLGCLCNVCTGAVPGQGMRCDWDVGQGQGMDHRVCVVCACGRGGGLAAFVRNAEVSSDSTDPCCCAEQHNIQPQHPTPSPPPPTPKTVCSTALPQHSTAMRSGCTVDPPPPWPCPCMAECRFSDHSFGVQNIRRHDCVPIVEECH